MRKTALILMAVMVILICFSPVNAQVNESINYTTNQTLPYNESNFPVSVFIHPEIIPSLQKSEWVYVTVVIKDTSGIYIDPKKPKDEKIQLYEQVKEYNLRIQEQIVANLSKDEFNVTELSESGHKIVGYISQKGLEKLNNSQYVESIVIPLMGTVAQENETNYTAYVDPALLEAFENEPWIEVIVRLIDRSNITIQGTKEQRRNLSLQKDAWFAPVIDSLLVTLNSTEFELHSKLSTGFGGKITKEGVEILAKNPAVREIIWVKGGGGTNTENSVLSNATENQTEMEQSDIAKPKSLLQKIINFFKSLFRWK